MWLQDQLNIELVQSLQDPGLTGSKKNVQSTQKCGQLLSVKVMSCMKDLLTLQQTQQPAKSTSGQKNRPIINKRINIKFKVQNKKLQN